MVLYKKLTASLQSGTNIHTFTDTIINDGTIVEAYTTDYTVYFINISQSGNTITVTVSDHINPVGICVTVSNVETYEPIDVGGITSDITTLKAEMLSAQGDISSLDGEVGNINTTLEGMAGDIESLGSLKQDKLTAGDNITITNNTISATDTVTEVIDSFDSTSTTAALSANKGRDLKDALTQYEQSGYLSKNRFDEQYALGKNHAGNTDGLRSLSSAISVEGGQSLYIKIFANPNNLKFALISYSTTNPSDFIDTVKPWFSNTELYNVTIPSNVKYVRLLVAKSDDSQMSSSDFNGLQIVISDTNSLDSYMKYAPSNFEITDIKESLSTLQNTESTTYNSFVAQKNGNHITVGGMTTDAGTTTCGIACNANAYTTLATLDIKYRPTNKICFPILTYNPNAFCYGQIKTTGELQVYSTQALSASTQIFLNVSYSI